MRYFGTSILTIILLSYAGGGSADQINECGIVSRIYGCLAFDPLAGGERQYLLDIESIPDSLLLLPVKVIGDAVDCDVECEFYPFFFCINDAQFLECEPEDLGCGVISGPHWDNSCYLWNSPTHGSLLTGLHGRSPGDTVGVIGIPDYRCSTWCPASGCLWYEVFYDCPDTNTATVSRSWGTLKIQFR